MYICMGWKRDVYVKNRKKGFKGLFPGNLSLVEVSSLAGMLIKYEEDFILCSKIEEAMGLVARQKELLVKSEVGSEQNNTLSDLYSANF